MKIGIFGGSFNPPHKMHKKIAKMLLKRKYIDKIIFVPTGTTYQYKTNLLPNKIRYDMLSILIKKEKNMSISKYEFSSTPKYTYQTLKHFQTRYPNDEIYFICGLDNLSYMDKWEHGNEILKNYKILLIKRKTDNLNDVLQKYEEVKENIIITSLKEKKTSSTNIREQLKKKDKKVLFQLPIGIYKYIKKHNLYG